VVKKTGEKYNTHNYYLKSQYELAEQQYDWS